MRVAVTGASGLIGSALVAGLRRDGHDVLRLVRRDARGADEVSWDPLGGTVDTARLSGIDACFHFAGAGVGDRRWTKSYKQVLWDSRVRGTRTIAAAMATLSPRPRVLVCGSAIGYYGDTGERAVDESAPRGSGFLAELVEAWEAAAEPAQAAGVRVVHPRSGLVVAAKGGAWGRMFPIFRLGVGGRLGSGRQYWSFVSLTDEVRGLLFLLQADELSGPVNLTAPEPARNAEVTRAMGRVLRRPTVLPVPAFALRAVLGEFSGEVLMSQRVLPRRLPEAGFAFAHPDVESAIRCVA